MEKVIKKQKWNGTRFFIYLSMFLLVASGIEANTIYTFHIKNTEAQEDIGFYKRMLENFCQKHYKELFTDFWGKREYIDGSLKVESMRIGGQREVNLYGIHNTKGRLGTPYQRKFKANIYKSMKTPNEYIITFERESKMLVTGESYMEARTKHFYYEE